MADLTSYNYSRPQMKTMDLLQWRSNGPIGAAIRWKTSGHVNHSSVVMSFPAIDITRKWTIEAVGKGLVLVLLSKKLYHYHGKCWWHPWQPRKDIKQQSRFAGRWLMEQLGKPYDFRSLFKNLLSKVSADAHSLFCSEAVFIPWKLAAIHMPSPHLDPLLKISKAPVPFELPEILPYDEMATRIL